MRSPHDHLFHYTFGEPEHAADLLRGSLPAAIARDIDWSTLTRCDAKLTDGEGESAYADLLFTVTIHGRPAYLFALLEHKSEADPDTVFQLLRYIVRIWERHRREQRDQRDLRLPAILVVVIHHGRTPWRGSRTLRDLIDVSGLDADLAASLLACQPEVTFILDDLAAQTQEQILARVSLLLPRLALLCMRFLRDTPDDEAEATLRSWRRLLASLHAATEAQEAFLEIVTYVATVTNLRRDRVRRILAEVHPDAERIYMKTYGRLHREAIQEGIAIGKVEGKAEGKAEGRAEILLRLLETRFGALDETSIARVRAASPADVELWAIAALSARTLAAVFEAGL